MKTNLYIYGKNESEKFDGSQIDTSIFNLILGPSKEDEDFLIKNSRYYRESLALKKYSFCSDVGRVFKLSQTKGLYVDASVVIGPEVSGLINKFDGYKTVLFRGNYKYIESGVLYSSIDKNPFFKKLFDNYVGDELGIASFILPVFISSYVLDDGFKPSWVFEERKETAIFTLDYIRNKATIWKTGVGSGGNKKTWKSKKYFDQISADGWKEWAHKFKFRIYDEKWNGMVDQMQKGALIDIKSLRNRYDSDIPKGMRRSLLKDYKKYKKSNSIRLQDRIIGSYFYRLFTLKTFKDWKADK